MIFKYRVRYSDKNHNKPQQSRIKTGITNAHIKRLTSKKKKNRNESGLVKG